MQKKAFVFMLYPTKEQAVMINNTTSCSRLVYNYSIEK
ncbi:MAG: helix-turn-helix domain-containing protein [Clostridiales bacterium]|nr:helix-turn-helix domain-containing protein [Clostridiales bacterium]